MEQGIISGIIGGVIAVFVCTYVSSKISHKSINGQLKFGLLISGLFWCCLAVVLLCIGVLVFAEINVERDFYPLLGLILGFGVSAIYSFGEAFKVHGQFDEDSIKFHTPWTGTKDEKWVDLVSVKFNSTANWTVLTFKSGAKIRLSALLGGHGLVLSHVKTLGHDS